MFKGIVYALSACFIWGLIFVVPQFMSGFSALEITLGRYFVYGTLSLLIFLKMCLKGVIHPQHIWIKASLFSLFCTMGYYILLVLALRYAEPAVCALILGISPITIAFYGNRRQKEIAYKKLILPSILILVGLVLINIPHFEASRSPYQYTLGLLFCLLALAIWSWYVVANAAFLKKHPQVNSSAWSTLIGVTSLFWVILFSLILGIFFEDHLHGKKYFTLSEEFVHFLTGSAILGLLCSWVGAFLWNKASLLLPVTLAGQLTAFETVFGVIFIYIVSRSTPTSLEVVGMGILLIAIVYGIRQFAKKRVYVEEISPH